MKFFLRQAQQTDVKALINLAVNSWSIYQKELDPEHWLKLYSSLKCQRQYDKLIDQSFSLICENDQNDIIGMVFLIPSGNPTEIYPSDWCYIRFLTVHPDYSRKGIGKLLTQKCIDYAIQTKEQTIALHTSEMMQKAIRLYTNIGFKLVREIPSRFGKKYWIYNYTIS